jgi:hypothetical protein
MTLETQSGRMTEPETLLAATLAASTTWQTMCNAASSAEALTHVHFDSLTPPDDLSEYRIDELDSLLPFAIVSTLSQGGMRVRRDGVGCLVQSGVLTLQIDCRIPEAQSIDSERGRWFKNRIGAIVTEMCERDSDSSYLTINAVDVSGYDFGSLEGEAVGQYSMGRVNLSIQYGIGEG